MSKMQKTPTQTFSCEYSNMFKNTFLAEHLLLLLPPLYMIVVNKQEDATFLRKKTEEKQMKKEWKRDSFSSKVETGRIIV